MRIVGGRWRLCGEIAMAVIPGVIIARGRIQSRRGGGTPGRARVGGHEADIGSAGTGS